MTTTTCACGRRARCIPIFAVLAVLATDPAAVWGQGSVSTPDSSISSGLTYWGTQPLAAADSTRELKGKDTKVMNAQAGFTTDGNLIIKEGAGVELDGDGDIVIGGNLPGAPVEQNTVVDISGPGSRFVWRDSDPFAQYRLDINGNYFHTAKSAKNVTINISDGGSFAFSHAAKWSVENSIGEAGNATLNITGAGSQMAIITADNLNDLGRMGNIRGDSRLEIGLGRGGLLDLRNAELEIFYSHFRYTIGNDGTGKTTSGLFRALRIRHANTDTEIVVDPCVKLKPGDQFLLAEYTQPGGTWSYGSLLPNFAFVSDGKVVTVSNGGLYQNQGYTFRISFPAPLGYNYPGTSTPAYGTIATVTAVPMGADVSCSASVQFVAGSNVSTVPFAVTGPGCSPGLYWGTQTLFVTPYATCRIQHHSRTINSDNTAWRFANWPDGGSTRERTIAIADLASFWVAKMQKQYRVWASASPAKGGSISGQGYFDAGSNVTAQGVPSAGFIFTTWDNLPSGIWPTRTVTFKLTQPSYLVAHFLQTMTLTSVYVPQVSGWMGQSTTLKAQLTTDRDPQNQIGMLWGTLNFEVNGSFVRSVNVYGAGWYQAELPYVPYGHDYVPVKVTFIPSAAGQISLLGSAGSGYLETTYCVDSHGCK